MGLKTGHVTSYTIENLTLENLITLIVHRKLRRLDYPGRPIVDIDASWVIRRCTRISYDMRVLTLMRLSLLLIKKGCRVNIVFDGNNRHHSKRSTTKRTIECYVNKIDYHESKFELSHQCEQVKLISDEEEKKKTTNLIDQNKKRLRTLEKKLSDEIIDVGTTLVERVKQQIEFIRSEFGDIIADDITYMIAEYQADSVLAYRTNNRMNDIVISSDSDQGVHTGSECICIKGYNIKDKNNKTNLDNISLFCSTNKTLEYICNVLNLPITSENIKIPKYPIMEYININLRCLFAIGIGCDVFLDGVPGVTPKSIHDFLISYNKKNQTCVSIDAMIEYYILMKQKQMKKEKKPFESDEKDQYKKMLLILMQTYLSEPANYSAVSSLVPPKENIYITSEYPTTIHPYNNGFQREDTTILIQEDTDDMCHCVGAGDGGHPFLKAEGIYDCHACNVHLCYVCMLKTDKQNKSEVYCINCYGDEKSIPIKSISLTDHVSRSDMIRALAELGVMIRIGLCLALGLVCLCGTG
jgi:hypothetical protein